MATTSFGKTTVRAGSFLKDGDTKLLVNGGCNVLFGSATTGTVACGSDDAITVTAVANYDDDGDGVNDFCELTVTTGTVDDVGTNAPGTAGKATTTCQAGSTVTNAVAVTSFASTSKFVNIEDALGLCGLEFKPLGHGEGGDANDYTVNTDDLEDRVQGVTKVNQAAAVAVNDVALVVENVYDLMGEANVAAARGAGTISVYIECGGKAVLVTDIDPPDDAFNPNRLTVTDPEANVPQCHNGATVKRLWSITMKKDFRSEEHTSELQSP